VPVIGEDTATIFYDIVIIAVMINNDGIKFAGIVEFGISERRIIQRYFEADCSSEGIRS
jgi:hypothetical protein